MRQRGRCHYGHDAEVEALSWDEFTWKVDVFLSKANYAVIALVAGVVFFLTLPFVAPYIFGPRGDLLGWLVEWLFVFTLFGFISGFLLKISWPVWRAPKWLYLVLLIVGGICLLSGWAALRDAGDVILPFKEREVVVARTYYDHPQTSRGAVPESGGWRIVTADGSEYKVRPSGSGDRLHAGSYRVELSHFKNIVMAAEPLQ
jgi:hypothetical protein